MEKNKVKIRFLPIPPSVAANLESEAKISDFEVKSTLGEGSFGKVYQVKHKKTGAIYAIKAIDKRNKNNQDGKPYFRREIEIMYKVNHPNIVRLFSHFEDDDYCYFVMEYISKGNLFSVKNKQKSKCFGEATVASYMRDVISAVYYLHNMVPPIIHRDIKPENVLLHEDGKLKLTDFGWSNYIDGNVVRSTYCGTPVYLAPEMIKEIGHDESLDIWCIGVLMFELLTGDIPFVGNNMNVLTENIIKTKISWPKDMNPHAKDLIKKILKPDPKDRISLSDMLKHPFFTNNVVNPTEFLLTPHECDNEGENNIFLLGRDMPQSNPVRKPKVQKSDQTITAPLSKPVGELKTADGTDMFKELYHKQKTEYEGLLTAYNELIKSNTDIRKKNEDLVNLEKFFNKEKTNLLREIEDKDNEKHSLQKQIASLNDTLFEKENALKNTSKTINSLEERKFRDENELKQLKKEIEELQAEKESLIKENKIKIEELEKQIIDGKEGSIYSNSTGESSNNVEALSKELAKEKEKHAIIIRNKDEEIKKLIDEKNSIKDNEAKKYEKIFSKYELTLKLRESEIENFKVKIKKLENALNLNNNKT
jgi:serine/threonine protein kinase